MLQNATRNNGKICPSKGLKESFKKNKLSGRHIQLLLNHLKKFRLSIILLLTIKIKRERSSNSRRFNQIIINEEGQVLAEAEEEDPIQDGHVELQIMSHLEDNGEDHHHLEVGLEDLEGDGEEDEEEEEEEDQLQVNRCNNSSNNTKSNSGRKSQNKLLIS